MKFSELEKEMTLKFEYGRSEISYLYIVDIDNKALAIEIKVFERKESILYREFRISEKVWNDWDMTYRRYSKANYREEIVSSILKQQKYIITI